MRHFSKVLAMNSLHQSHSNEVLQRGNCNEINATELLQQSISQAVATNQ